MTDLERYNLILRYEALVDHIKLNTITSYEEGLLVSLEKVMMAYLSSEELTELQRRKLITKVIIEELNPLYKELGENLLDDMVATSLMTGNYLSGTYLESPVVKALKFNARTLIHNYELGDLISSNNNEHIKRYKRIIAEGITEGKNSSVVYRELKKLNDKTLSHVSHTVVQSSMAEAREQAKDQVFLELEKQGVIKGYEFVATLEMNTCAICAALDSKQWKKLEDIAPEEKPKIHFRCRCVLAPIGSDDAQRAGQQYYESEEGVAKKGSEFPDIDFYQWVKLQPKSVQSAIRKKQSLSVEEFDKLMKA